MRADVLDEPELEFGGESRHIDPRFGISSYGPADLGSADAQFIVDGAEGYDLGWYATQEIGPLLELL